MAVVNKQATDALIKLYKKTYNEIVSNMTDAASRSQLQKVSTLANIKSQLDKLGVKTDDWVGKNIPDAYNAGRKIAVNGLKNLYETPVWHAEGGVNGGALLGQGYYVSFDKSVAKEFGDKLSKSYLGVFDPNKAYVIRSQDDIDAVFKKAVKAFPNIKNPQEAMTNWYKSKGYDIVIGKDDPSTGILVVNKKVLSPKPLTVDDGFSVKNQKMLKALVNSTTQSFGDSLSTVNRSARNIFTKQLQEEIKQQIASGALQNETGPAIAARVKEQLTNEGLTALRDKGGRTWSMDRYADMLSRTQLAEARNNGLTTQMLENDQDLVMVSINGSDHPECAVWEGQVLSITGNTPGFDTVDDAESEGLFHPNCEHVIDPIEMSIAELTDGWNSETGEYEAGMFAQDGYDEITIDSVTQDAVDAGAMPRGLAMKGYTMDKDGNPFDPDGRPMSVGKFQQAAQNRKLTQDENLINRGGKTYRKVEEEMQY